MTKGKKVSLNEIKIGDRLIFNDGREKLTVTVLAKLNSKGEIRAKWRRRELILLPSDFKNGYIRKK